MGRDRVGVLGVRVGDRDEKGWNEGGRNGYGPMLPQYGSMRNKIKENKTTIKQNKIIISPFYLFQRGKQF